MMKTLSKLFLLTSITIVITSCARPNLARLDGGANIFRNPLKTVEDLKIEKVISSGTWVYERQPDDCDDTAWTQNFYTNRYYKSVGAACLIPDAFSVNAESWYVKNKTLYMTNLNPVDANDIIIKYGIDYLDSKRMRLSSGEYHYYFNK